MVELTFHERVSREIRDGSAGTSQRTGVVPAKALGAARVSLGPCQLMEPRAQVPAPPPPKFVLPEATEGWTDGRPPIQNEVQPREAIFWGGVENLRVIGFSC